MSQPYDEDRVAAELRHAAASFEPDTERIRRLMDARMASTDARRSVSLGILVPFRRGARSGSPGRGTAGTGPHRFRPLVWPAVGLVATASVILAVATSGTAPAVPGFGIGNPQATITMPAGAPSGGPASSTGSSSGDPTGSTGTASDPSKVPPIIGDATSEGTPPPVTPPSLTSSPFTSSRISPTATPVPGLHHTVVGDRDITVYVKPVPIGRTAQLGQTPGEQWVIPATVDAGGQLHNRGTDWGIGPVQVMGHGGVIADGPYSVTWRGGQDADPTGSSRQWLTVPQSAEGVPSALRVPVRFHTVPVTATLLTGTMHGRGLLVANLPGGPGSSGSTMQVDLPGCSTPCALLVTVTVRPVSASSPKSGDLTIDLMAAAPNVTVGLAGASLS